MDRGKENNSNADKHFGETRIMNRIDIKRNLAIQKVMGTPLCFIPNQFNCDQINCSYSKSCIGWIGMQKLSSTRQIKMKMG